MKVKPFFAVCIFSLLLLVSTASALPPQLQAVNAFIANDSLLRRIHPRSMGCYLDNNGVAHFIFNYLESDGTKPAKYVSFSADGSVRVDAKIILPCGALSCYGSYRMLADDSGNLHCFVKSRLHAREDEYEYFMLDADGELKKHIKIEEPIVLSYFHLFPDGRLIANGYDIAPLSDSMYLVLVILEPGSKEFRAMTVAMPQSENYRRKVRPGDFLPLGENRIVMVRAEKHARTAEFYISRMVVDLASEEVVESDYFPTLASSSLFYNFANPGFGYGLNHLIPLSDSLFAFLTGISLRKTESGLRLDSLCVVLFDKAGYPSRDGAPELRQFIMRRLDEFTPYDYLFRTQVDFKSSTYSKARQSLYGIISFRDFPEIIIDSGNR